MKTIATNLAAALSLLLCIATAAMWISSYFKTLDRTWNSGQSSYPEYDFRFVEAMHGGLEICIGHGRIENSVIVHNFGSDADSGFIKQTPPKPYPRFNSMRSTFPNYDVTVHGFRFCGFEAQHEIISSPSYGVRLRLNYFVIPLPAVVAVTALLPTMAVTRWRRRRRFRRAIKKNCCPSCGYDLRATPDRCPECGTPCETTAI